MFDPTNSTDDITAQVEARVQEETEKLAIFSSASGSGEEKGLSHEFVMDCLASNELGDGLLFEQLHRGKFLYDAAAGQWYRWTGHYWKMDVECRSLAAVENVALAYANATYCINKKISSTEDDAAAEVLKAQRKSLNRRIDKLRNIKGRLNCLAFSTTLPVGALTNGKNPLVTTGALLDQNPWLLACQNGVVDLRTGVLRPGRSDDFLTKPAPFTFPENIVSYLATGENSLAPNWGKFLLEVMEDDQEMVDFLHRLFGYCLTGSIKEHIFVVFAGGGRNGKSTMVDTIQKVVGTLAGQIPPEMLLDQGRIRNSAGPSPDVMSLKGLRMAFAAESDQGRGFARAGIKRLTGGEEISGRNPHDRYQVTFRPTHKLIFSTNDIPRADPNDRAFWLRMHLVEFPLSFVNNPVEAHERSVDKDLPAKLLEEASGILAWMVRGALLWQEQGLDPPKKVTEATANLRRKEDDLAEFLEAECHISPESKVSAKEAYAAFKKWYVENVAERVPSAKKFGEMLAKRFERGRESSGRINYHGLDLKNQL